MVNRIQMSLFATALGLASLAVADAPKTKPPEGAKVYLISPRDGDVVSNPVLVRFGLKGMGIAPAGIENPKTGHHHLLVDLDAKDVDLKAPYPFNEQTRHFGGGQTEASLDLKPGNHTLQLLFGDGKHTSFDPPLTSEKITITVK